METNLRSKPPRQDPDRWKPVVNLVLPLLMVAPLVCIEYLLVSEMFRTGSLRGLFQAILYGLLLAILIPAWVISVWRRFHRPNLEQVVQQAKNILSQNQAASSLVSKSRSPVKPSKLIYAALPVTFFLLALFGIWMDRWIMFFTMLAGTIVGGGAMLFVFSREALSVVQTFRSISLVESSFSRTFNL